MHYFIISCIKSMVVQQLDALFADLYGDPNAEDLRAAHVRNNRQEILLWLDCPGQGQVWSCVHITGALWRRQETLDGRHGWQGACEWLTLYYHFSSNGQACCFHACPRVFRFERTIFICRLSCREHITNPCLSVVGQNELQLKKLMIDFQTLFIFEIRPT